MKSQPTGSRYQGKCWIMNTPHTRNSRLKNKVFRALKVEGWKTSLGRVSNRSFSQSLGSVLVGVVVVACMLEEIKQPERSVDDGGRTGVAVSCVWVLGGLRNGMGRG